MVEEGESSTLSSHRAVAATREPDRVVIGVRRIFGYHTQCLVDAVIVDQTNIRLSNMFNVRLILNLQSADRTTYREQTPCKKPFGQVVIVAQTPERSRRDRRYDALKTLQV